MKKYFENLAKALFGMQFTELDKTEQSVIESIANQSPIATNLNDSFHENLTFGQKVADKVAEFGGSWTFILLFLSIMLSWIVTNTFYLLSDEPFDPYPFILLNLVLSTIAALQAPIIMMSQNRQASKDRMAANLNYQVSLKTDLEIIRLNQKMDVLIDKYAPESKEEKSND